MEMKYYNPSNNFRAPIPREPKAYRPPQSVMDTMHTYETTNEPPKTTVKPVAEEMPKREICEETCEKEKKNFLSNLTQDDIVILGVLFLLLLNSCDDYLLLLALGFIFLSGRQK